MSVRYTLPALADLDRLLAEIEFNSKKGLRRVQTRLAAVEKLIEAFPGSGSRTRLPWLRRIVVAPFPYLVFYEATATGIVIHAIRHGASRPADLPG